MRSHMTKLNKWLSSLVMICLLIMMFGMSGSMVYALGYGEATSISVPYTQIYDADKTRTNDTFNYRVTPVDGAPMPDGKSSYDFAVKAVPNKAETKGSVSLNIAFPKPGIYNYNVASYEANKQDGFTYASEKYTVEVTVSNDGNGGLKTPMVNVVSGGKKTAAMEFKPSHVPTKVPKDRTRPQTTPRGDGNAAVGVAAPGEPEVVETEPEPENPVVEIAKDLVPKADPDRNYWALVNLLAALGCIAIAGVMIARYFQRIDTDEDEYIIRREGKLRLVGIIPALVAVITFIATEDLTLPMGLVDEWTWLMLVAFAVSAITAFAAYKKYDSGDSSDNSGQNGNRQASGSLA